MPTESYGSSFDINYGCPCIQEASQTLRCTTAPGYTFGVEQIIKKRKQENGKDGNGAEE